MSWLFSQALAEEYSEDTSLGGEQFAQLNVMPTPHKFWRNDKTMEFSDLSRFGLTLRLLTGSHGAELLTSFLVAFHAKTSPLQERERESKESAPDCGNSSTELLAKWDQQSSMWKTAQCSLFEDLELSLETWPRAGSMRNGECYQQEMLADATCVKDAGLSLPTPTCSDNYTGNLKSSQQKPGSMHSVTLPQALRMMLPTIGANEYKGSSKDRYINSIHFRGAKMCEGLRTCEADATYLNPYFAEVMMGWPLGWSVLEPLEMDKFLEWQQQHSTYFQTESMPTTERNQMYINTSFVSAYESVERSEFAIRDDA